MNTPLMIRGVYASFLVGFGACAASTDADASDTDRETAVSAEQRLLAAVDIEGGKAQFVATGPDELWITTDTVGVSSPLHDPALRGLNAAETYEYWTGTKAPAELVEHASRMARPDNALVHEIAHSEVGGGVGVTTAALSGTDFMNGYCDGMEYCWLNRTGTWENEERARYWLGYVDAVQGDMTIQMRRRDVAGGWGNVWTKDLPGGHVYGALGATSDAVNKRPLKFKIYNADGDIWQLAANWD